MSAAMTGSPLIRRHSRQPVIGAAEFEGSAKL